MSPLELGTAPLGNLYRAIDDDTAATTVVASTKIGRLLEANPPCAPATSGTSVVVGGVFNSGLLSRLTVDDRARFNYQHAAISSQLWGALVDTGLLRADAPTLTSLAT